MSQLLSAQLSTGTVSVAIHQALVNPTDLFGFAERCNPKRAFLFVSKVLGRHVPVPPSTMRKTYKDLAAALPTDAPGPVLVVGMAETAVGLGAGVHECYSWLRGGDDAVYLTTTRHRLPSELLCEFSEDHSHAAHHMIHRPADPQIDEMVRSARTLILVDDEASTGNTFKNLHRALVGAGIDQVENIYLVTLTDWSAGKAAEDIGATSVSLVTGQYRWEPLVGAVTPAAPRVDLKPRPLITPDPSQDWGRLGIVEHSRSSWGDINPARAPGAGTRVLVVGTGEYVWQPFLLAEWLERRGADVRFSCVTRSPIPNGHAIRHGVAFADNYGLGVANFLYNVDRTEYDRIYLCSETPIDCIDPILIDHLRPEVLSASSMRLAS